MVQEFQTARTPRGCVLAAKNRVSSASSTFVVGTEKAMRTSKDIGVFHHDQDTSWLIHLVQTTH